MGGGGSGIIQSLAGLVKIFKEGTDGPALARLWGGVFAVMTVSHVIADEIDHKGTNIIFNWVIPIALVISGSKQSTGVKHDNAANVQAA
jgi:hypothetical protein